MVRVFISHSSRDAALAASLADLLRAALRLSSAEIRCTSVDGYRLPAGADTDDSLREEIVTVPVLVGLISDSSVESAYVLFELGARWGTRQPLIPLLAPGVSPASLRGPLLGLNALSCSSIPQLLQFVSDIGGYLSVLPEPPASYQRHVEAVASTRSEAPRIPTAVERAAAHRASTARGLGQVPPAVLATIRTQVQRRHPDNFTMQEFAEGQEIAAYLRLHPPSA